MTDHQIKLKIDNLIQEGYELYQNDWSAAREISLSIDALEQELETREQELFSNDPLEQLPKMQSMSPSWELGHRPFCFCCGGQHGKGKRRYGKAQRKERCLKDSRAKPKYKDKRKQSSQPKLWARIATPNNNHCSE